jgi:hypothetical protein
MFARDPSPYLLESDSLAEFLFQLLESFLEEVTSVTGPRNYLIFVCVALCSYAATAQSPCGDGVEA